MPVRHRKKGFRTNRVHGKLPESYDAPEVGDSVMFLGPSRFAPGIFTVDRSLWVINHGNKPYRVYWLKSKHGMLTRVRDPLTLINVSPQWSWL